MRLRRIVQVLVAMLIAAQPAHGQIAQPPVWSLTRDARFGSDDGSDGELSSPQAVTVGPNGHVFIFDYRPHHIKEYDRTGRFIGTIGRSGKGPGELANVHTLGFLGDTLWASDVDQDRITLYAPPGRRDAKTYSFPYSPGQAGVLRGTASGMLQNGLAVAQGTLFIPRTMRDADIPSPIVLLRRDGTIADTMATPRMRGAGEIGVRVQTVVNGETRTMGVVSPQPFLAHPMWKARPDGSGIVLAEAPVVTANGPATFTIQTFDGSGKRVAARNYSYQPMALTDRLLDSVVTAQTGRFGPDGERSFREQLVTPKYLPPITQLVVGLHGATWVRREQFGHGGAMWNVIDGSGAIVGRVTMPAGLRVVYADLSQVLGVERDADGIPWVVRYRVGRDGR